MGDDRPSCYYEGDTLIIRASAIGTSCLWELVAAGQGYEQEPVSDKLQEAFDMGHELEPVINDRLRELGYEITGSQDEGHLDIDPGLRIRFHPDGYIRHTKAKNMPPRILEDKTMADSSWQRAVRGSVGDIFAEYNWQISVMMWANATDHLAADPSKWYMPALWVAYNKGNADGTPCPDQGRLHFETLDRPPISLNNIKDKARLIRSLVEGEDILESGRPCDDPTHYPCRYLSLRPEPEPGDIPVTAPGKKVKTTRMVEDEAEAVAIDNKVRDYLIFKGQADEAKQRLDAAKEALIEAAQGHDYLTTARYHIPIIEGTNTSPDWANMPEEVAREAKKYKKESKYKYIKGIKPLD